MSEGDRVQTMWIRRIAVIAALAVVHLTLTCGPATKMLLTDVPRRCWVDPVDRSAMSVDGAPDCNEAIGRFVEEYEAAQLATSSVPVLGTLVALALWIPVIASGGLVGLGGLPTGPLSGLQMVLVIHALAALLWAVVLYALWSLAQTIRRRRWAA